MRVSCRMVVLALMLSGLAEHARGAYPVSVPVPPGKAQPFYKLHQVAARDGILLAVHEWSPPASTRGRPVVLFVHGIGMHGEPYGAIAAGFTTQGIALFAPDLRGHGRSEGPRGVLADPHVLRADLGAAFELIDKRYPGSPVVLVGDSMGGLLAADYAWRGERRLAGLGMLVPAFGVHIPRLGKASAELAQALGSGHVALGTPDNMRAASRDQGFIKARLADPLALPDVRVSYLLTIAKLQQDWPKAAAEIRVPLFVCVAGKDEIVDNSATKRVFERMATAPPSKNWRMLDDSCHTVCWDPNSRALVAELAAWALQRSE